MSAKHHHVKIAAKNKFDEADEEAAADELGDNELAKVTSFFDKTPPQVGLCSLYYSIFKSRFRITFSF